MEFAVCLLAFTEIECVFISAVGFKGNLSLLEILFFGPEGLNNWRFRLLF